MLLFFPLLMRLALHWSVFLARTFFFLLNKRIHFFKKTVKSTSRQKFVAVLLVKAVKHNTTELKLSTSPHRV